MKLSNIQYFTFLLLALLFVLLLWNKKIDVIIIVGNSFKNYYDLPVKPIKCRKMKKIYNCFFTKNHSKNYKGIIYNGNVKFPNKTNKCVNIVISTEKLSRVKFMKDVGDGNSNIFQLAIDYRLFNNHHHISYPVYSSLNLINISLHKFINISRSNFVNLSLFLKRKNVVYIQRKVYKNRQYLVKEFMKYIPIDSYGKDLKNKEWPINISRKNKLEVLKQYKFCIAIENSVESWKKEGKFEASSIDNDYVTEKLTDCLMAGSIPIYFGPHNINVFLPNPYCIINFNSFSSIKSLTDYIKYIMKNRKLIQIYSEWQNNISKEWLYRFTKTFTFNYCDICNYLA